MAINLRSLSCAYCGDRATCRDHVIPVCSLRYRRTRFRRGDWAVPACHECNQTLGAELLLTVPGRAAFLITRYTHRWRKLLKAPVWTPSELSELDGNFYRRIEAIETLRAECLIRLSHLSAITLLDDDYLRP